MKYFDYAATCPLDKSAAEAYVKAATEFFGNTQSLHDTGTIAKQLVENCRVEFARMLGVQQEGIYFTSGGTESNLLAIHALLSQKKKQGQHIITGIAEHSSIHSTLAMLEGYEVTTLPFSKDGIIQMEDLRAAIRPDTVLVSIQHVNPEIGTIQPIQEIGELCKRYGILFHSDCVQSFGKIPLDQVTPYLDSLSISGHKFYGPKGIGVLYLSPNINYAPFYPNASHERGMRPGTLNTPAIVSMTTAACEQVEKLEATREHLQKLRTLFLRKISELGESIERYEGPIQSQLPSIVGLRILGLEGQWVMLEANRRGFAVSTGSACQVGKSAPSKTMTALGVEQSEAKGFIRISFGLPTYEQDVELLAEALLEIAGSNKEQMLHR